MEFIHGGNVGVDEGYRGKNGRERLFFYYDVDQGDELSEEERSRIRGGKTIYGRIAAIQETFGFSQKHILWGESWASIMMKLVDKPHTVYEKKEKTIKLKSKEEIYKALGKYVKKG